MGTNQRMRSLGVNGPSEGDDRRGIVGGEMGGESQGSAGGVPPALSSVGGGGAPSDRACDPGGILPPDLATLLPTVGNEVVSVELDRGFANAYPRLWTCLTAGKRARSDKPRAPGELAIRQDGAVWVVVLTMPEELYSLAAETPMLGDVFASLERRLALEPIPWRKASKYAKRRQLSPDKKEVAK